MKLAGKLPILVAVALFAGCVTNDFKVVDALKRGMTPQEAQATITAFGFTLARSLARPATGWPVERKTFDAADWRAGREEGLSGKQSHWWSFIPWGTVFLAQASCSFSTARMADSTTSIGIKSIEHAAVGPSRLGSP